VIKLHEYEKREFWKAVYIGVASSATARSSDVAKGWADKAVKYMEESMEQQEESPSMLGNIAAPINPAYALPRFPSRAKGRRNN